MFEASYRKDILTASQNSFFLVKIDNFVEIKVFGRSASEQKAKLSTPWEVKKVETKAEKEK